MEYITLFEIAPFALLWMAPILGLGLAIFLVLTVAAMIQDRRTTSE